MTTVDDFLESVERKRMECPHENFRADASVGRLSAVDGGPVVYYSVDLKITCTDCGQPLEFSGIPHGLSAYHPTVSIDEQEVRLPMVIPGKMIPAGLPGFGVKCLKLDESPLVTQ